MRCRRRGGPGEVLSRELLGELRRRDLRHSRLYFVVLSDDGLFLPRQLGRGEAVAPGARRLATQCIERAPDAAVRHVRLELVHIERAHDAAPACASAQEWRVGVVRRLGQPRTEHRIVHPLHQRAAVVTDGLHAVR